jgi:hypothetical protein
MVADLDGAILRIEFPCRKCRQWLVGLRNPPDSLVHLPAQEKDASEKFATEKILEGVRFLIAGLVADDNDPSAR